MFNQDKVSQMLAEAEAEALAEAKVKIKQAMVDDLVKQSGVKSDADVEGLLLPSPIINFEPLAQESEDWAVIPLPAAEDEFKETDVFGLKLRVNRAGTKVERFVSGKWDAVNITVLARNATPAIIVPNNYCPGSKCKRGLTSFRVSQLVLQAFTEMPSYMTKVYFTAKGPTIMFGLKLAYHNDGNLKNCALENLHWRDQSSFKTAVERRAEKLGATLPS